MSQADTTHCPFCAREILEAGFLCKHCGKHLHPLRIANLKAKAISEIEHYEIVQDGRQFGIAFMGKVILHAMDKERAQNTAQILNEVLQMERAS